MAAAVANEPPNVQAPARALAALAFSTWIGVLLVTSPGVTFAETVSSSPLGMLDAANCATPLASIVEVAQGPWLPGVATEQVTSCTPPGTEMLAFAAVIEGIADPVTSQYSSS